MKATKVPVTAPAVVLELSSDEALMLRAIFGGGSEDESAAAAADSSVAYDVKSLDIRQFHVDLHAELVKVVGR